MTDKNNKPTESNAMCVHNIPKPALPLDCPVFTPAGVQNGHVKTWLRQINSRIALWIWGVSANDSGWFFMRLKTTCKMCDYSSFVIMRVHSNFWCVFIPYIGLIM